MDYFAIVVNAICTGLGVSIGSEIWFVIKARREKLNLSKFKEYVNNETKLGGKTQ